MASTGSQESKFLMGGEKLPSSWIWALKSHQIQSLQAITLTSNASILYPVPHYYEQCFHTLPVLQVLNSVLAAILPSSPCCWSKAAHECNRSMKVLVHMQSVYFRLNKSGFLQQNSSLLACPWCISITVSSTSHLDTIFLDCKKLALPSLLPTLSR